MFSRLCNLPMVLCYIIFHAQGHYIHPQDFYSEEGEAALFDKDKGKKVDKLNFGNIFKLKNDHVPPKSSNIKKNVDRPYWEVRTTQTKSYSYREYLDNDEQELHQGRFEYVEQDELNIKNNQNNQVLRISYTHSDDTTCLNPIQLTEDIAVLFNNDFNIPKQIFPLCCRDKMPTLVTNRQPITNPHVTQSLLKPTRCQTSTTNNRITNYSSKNNPSLTSTSEKNTTLVSSNNIMQSSSTQFDTPMTSANTPLTNYGGIINVAVHVQCCQSDKLCVTNPIRVEIQNAVQSTPSVNIIGNIPEKSEITNKAPGYGINSPEGIDMNLSNSLNTASNMERNLLNSDHASENIVVNQPVRPECLQNAFNTHAQQIVDCNSTFIAEGCPTHGIEVDAKEINALNGPIKESHPKAVHPHKLLPFDITFKTTRRSFSRPQTHKRPIYLCQITNSIARPWPRDRVPATTPYHGVWRKMSFPHFGTKKGKRYHDDPVTRSEMFDCNQRMGFVPDHDNFHNIANNVPKTSFEPGLVSEVVTKVEEPLPGVTVPFKKEGGGEITPTMMTLGEVTSSSYKTSEDFHTQYSTTSTYSTNETVMSLQIVSNGATIYEPTKVPSNENSSDKAPDDLHTEVNTKVHEETVALLENTDILGNTFSRIGIEKMVVEHKSTIISETISTAHDNTIKTTDNGSSKRPEIMTESGTTDQTENEINELITTVSETEIPSTISVEDTFHEPNNTDKNRTHTTLIDIENSKIIDSTAIPLANSEPAYVFNDSVNSIETMLISNNITLKNQTTFEIEMSSTTTSYSEINTTDVQLISPYTDSKTSDKNYIQHIINLSKDKYLFYWRETWHVTDRSHVWSFTETTDLMNKTFFSLLEDKTSSDKEVIRNILNKNVYNNNVKPNIMERMPFEVFSESILLLNFSSDINFKWGDHLLGYDDVIAMLRLSDFKTSSDRKVGSKWGQINWEAIYSRIKQAPKENTQVNEEYKVTDFGGTSETLSVYTNGTSTWKGKTITITETVSTVKKLNSELELSENLITTSYQLQDSTFDAYIVNAINNKTVTKNKYVSYNWGGHNFTWEDLLAISAIKMRQDKTKQEGNFNNAISAVEHSSKDWYPDRTVFKIKYNSSMENIIVYRNQSVFYGNSTEDLFDIKQFIATYSSKSMLLSSISYISTMLTKVVDITYIPVLNKIAKLRTKEWEEFRNKKEKNNSSSEVLYPVNMGSGLVQFSVKSQWFITDGINLWAFESGLTNAYINKLVFSTILEYDDDPKITQSYIQQLVNKKIAERDVDLRIKLVMPFELIAQHLLFFSKYNISGTNPLYTFGTMTLGPEDVIASLRLAAVESINNGKYQLVWSSGRRINWQWLVQEVNNGNKTKGEKYHEYIFTSGSFLGKPNLLVYSNLTSTWGSQSINPAQIMEQVMKSNNNTRFVPAEINTTYDMLGEESFEWFYKSILQKRIKQNRIYKEYNWKGIKFTWFKLLVCLRSADLLSNSVRDNRFWKDNMMKIDKSKRTDFTDRTEFQVDLVSEFQLITMYMNESTVAKGKLLDLNQLINLYGENYFRTTL